MKPNTFLDYFEWQVVACKELYRLGFVDWDFQDRDRGLRFMYHDLMTGITATIRYGNWTISLEYSGVAPPSAWRFCDATTVEEMETDLNKLLSDIKLLGNYVQPK